MFSVFSLAKKKASFFCCLRQRTSLSPSVCVSLASLIIISNMSDVLLEYIGSKARESVDVSKREAESLVESH